MQKSLKDISWQVSEEVYRADPALSYSLLAKYERGGFNSIPTLFDRVESPSLLYGSCVDSIITGGMDEFNERFVVCDIPEVPDSIQTVLHSLKKVFGNAELVAIPTHAIIEHTELCKYQLNWKPETRAKVIREKGTEYYKSLVNSDGKQVITKDLYLSVIKAVNALHISKASEWYFRPDIPFDSIERCYQLKFKVDNDNVHYRTMMDLCVVDHENKIVYPVDLKTSHKKEWDFYKSFVEWRYDIQDRLYYRALKAAMEQDEYFKDFKIEHYVDIVVCKDSLIPGVWRFTDDQKYGTLTYGTSNNIVMRDPFDIGYELNEYLTSNAKVPDNFNMEGQNDLIDFMNKL